MLSVIPLAFRWLHWPLFESIHYWKVCKVTSRLLSANRCPACYLLISNSWILAVGCADNGYQRGKWHLRAEFKCRLNLFRSLTANDFGSGINQPSLIYGLNRLDSLASGSKQAIRRKTLNLKPDWKSMVSVRLPCPRRRYCDYSSSTYEASYTLIGYGTVEMTCRNKSRELTVYKLTIVNEVGKTRLVFTRNSIIRNNFRRLLFLLKPSFAITPKIIS